MADAKAALPQPRPAISAQTLRARAQCRRETAERLWDERLERLLLEEAEELERRAAALELQAAVEAEEEQAQRKQPDLAALRAASKWPPERR